MGVKRAKLPNLTLHDLTIIVYLAKPLRRDNREIVCKKNFKTMFSDIKIDGGINSILILRLWCVYCGTK